MKSRLLTQIIIAALTVGLFSQTLRAGDRITTVTEPSEEISFVLNQFRNKSLEDCVKLMDRLRPQAVTPQEKTILRKNGFELVTPKTEITDPALIAELYQQTQKVLEFHHRAGIVEYILFKHEDPLFITKAGAFIAISNRALDLADNDHARSGIIAHELSHEYFAMQFLDAYQTHNCRKLRVIELLCDVFATITMIQLKMDPDRFAEALRKIVHNSKESEQLNDGNKEMPSLEARLRVISEIKKQFLHPASP
jgi:Zn-dependent protease with chaperone function